VGDADPARPASSGSFVLAIRRAILDLSGEDMAFHGARGGEGPGQPVSSLPDTELDSRGWSATCSSVSQRRYARCC